MVSNDLVQLKLSGSNEGSERAAMIFSFVGTFKLHAADY